MLSAGIATAAVAIEEHQESLIDPLVEAGAVVRLSDEEPEAARHMLRRLLTDASFRDDLVRRGNMLFREPGAVAIADAIVNECRERR